MSSEGVAFPSSISESWVWLTLAAVLSWTWDIFVDSRRKATTSRRTSGSSSFRSIPAPPLAAGNRLLSLGAPLPQRRPHGHGDRGGAPHWGSPMHAFRKLTVLLLLFVLLVPLAASAASSKAGSHKPAKAERTLASLGSLVRALASGIWTKAGMGIDPSGSPASAPGSGSPTDAGLGIDPHGGS